MKSSVVGVVISSSSSSESASSAQNHPVLRAPSRSEENATDALPNVTGVQASWFPGGSPDIDGVQP
jgi:hypothetical protein